MESIISQINNDILTSGAGLVVCFAIGILLGAKFGRNKEAQRWAKIAYHLTYPAMSNKQSLWYKGIQYVVMTHDRYIGIVGAGQRHIYKEVKVND